MKSISNQTISSALESDQNRFRVRLSLIIVWLRSGQWSEIESGPWSEDGLIRTSLVWKVLSENLWVWKIWSEVTWVWKVWSGLISVWKVWLEVISVWKVWSDENLGQDLNLGSWRWPLILSWSYLRAVKLGNAQWQLCIILSNLGVLILYSINHLPLKLIADKMLFNWLT